MIARDLHAELVLACDVVLNTPDTTPDEDLFDAVTVLADPAHPYAVAEQQVFLAMLLWLRRELGPEVVAQVRANHVAKARL